MKSTVFAVVLACLTFPEIVVACNCPTDGLTCDFSSCVKCKLGGEHCSCSVVNHTCQLCGTCSLGRCSTCSCSSAVHFVPSWTSDSTLEVKLHTFSPAMAQIVADLQKSAAAGNLCSSMLEGKTILVLGDPRTIVSWRFFSLRDGVDHLETDKGEAFEASPRQWTFYVNKKEVTRGEVEVSPVHGQNKRH